MDSLPSSNSMSKPFPIAVVVRIVGNASGPIGIGITLTGWLNPLIGVGALMIGAGYVIWELSALDAVKHNVPGMLRLLAVVMIAAVTVGLSWRPIRAAVTKNTLQPHIPTAAEIAAEVWKHRPQDRPTLSTITPRPAPKGIGHTNPTTENIAGPRSTATLGSSGATPSNIEVVLSCLPVKLPITIPAGQLGYIILLNEAANKRSKYLEFPVGTLTGKAATTWPSPSVIRQAKDIDLFGVATQCEVSNRGDTNLLDLTLPLQSSYGEAWSNMKSYDVTVVINPLDKGQSTSFYIINTCPVSARIHITDFATVKLSRDDYMHRFHLELPDGRGESTMYGLNESKVNWGGTSCN